MPILKRDIFLTNIFEEMDTLKSDLWSIYVVVRHSVNAFALLFIGQSNLSLPYSLDNFNFLDICIVYASGGFYGQLDKEGRANLAEQEQRDAETKQDTRVSKSGMMCKQVLRQEPRVTVTIVTVLSRSLVNCFVNNLLVNYTVFTTINTYLHIKIKMRFIKYSWHERTRFTL